MWRLRASRKFNTSYPPASQTIVHPAGSLVSGSSAHYGYSFAPETIVSAFGSNLASALLGGTSVTVKDAAGTSRQAPLFYASPGQINYLLPAGTANGTATVSAANGSTVSTGSIQVASIGPAFYTATQTGQGSMEANRRRRSYPGRLILALAAIRLI